MLGFTPTIRSKHEVKTGLGCAKLMFRLSQNTIFTANVIILLVKSQIESQITSSRSNLEKNAFISSTFGEFEKNMPSLLHGWGVLGCQMAGLGWISGCVGRWDEKLKVKLLTQLPTKLQLSLEKSVLCCKIIFHLCCSCFSCCRECFCCCRYRYINLVFSINKCSSGRP